MPYPILVWASRPVLSYSSRLRRKQGGPQNSISVYPQRGTRNVNENRCRRTSFLGMPRTVMPVRASAPVVSVSGRSRTVLYPEIGSFDCAFWMTIPSAVHWCVMPVGVRLPACCLVLLQMSCQRLPARLCNEPPGEAEKKAKRSVAPQVARLVLAAASGRSGMRRPSGRSVPRLSCACRLDGRSSARLLCRACRR